NLQHVLANRQCIQHMLSLPAELVWLQQTHSVRVVCADQVSGCPEADASYTDKKNIVIK
ncbi:MAG: multi-copper polyphenol oxidoreductase, partial [Draconibacterium sp.]|nr:multi-copper polyphenol oxidoreductase [Draconibacterium sp.]